MKIECIEDIEVFRGLRADWNALLDRSLSDSVFLTWEWLFTWWDHFHGRKQLFILVVTDEVSSQIIAIAPWYLEEVSFFPFRSLKKISFLGTGKVSSDFLDLIVSHGQEKPVLECLAAYLQTQKRKWDVIEFNDLSEDSATLKPLLSLRFPGACAIDRTTDVCPYISLPPDHSAFLSSRGPKLRRNLKKDTRAVEVEHRMRFAFVTDPEQLTQAIDRMLALHHERFGAKSPEPAARSNFSGQPIRDFHCDAAARMFTQGWLKLFFLEHDRLPVAFLYTFQYRGKTFAYQSGFSCAWEKLGLGNVLFNYAIRDSIQAGFREFHFLRGGESYKGKWTRTAKRLHTVTWTNANPAGRIYSIYLRIRERSKLWLFRLGLKRTPALPSLDPMAPPVTE